MVAVQNIPEVEKKMEKQKISVRNVVSCSTKLPGVIKVKSIDSESLKTISDDGTTSTLSFLRQLLKDPKPVTALPSNVSKIKMIIKGQNSSATNSTGKPNGESGFSCL